MLIPKKRDATCLQNSNFILKQLQSTDHIKTRNKYYITRTIPISSTFNQIEPCYSVKVFNLFLYVNITYKTGIPKEVKDNEVS